MGRAGYDANNQPTLIVLSNDGLRAPVELYADPVTHELLVNASADSATGVTVPANAFYQGIRGPSSNLVGMQSASIANGQFDTGLLGVGVLGNSPSDFKYYSVAADNAADTMATGISLFVWAQNAIYNGTTWDRMRGDATNGVDVDVTRMPRATTPSQSSVASSASNVTLLASNTARKGATFFNDSTAVLYLKLGATASNTSYTTQLGSNTYYELPYNYTGIVDGIWASANGNCRITELT